MRSRTTRGPARIGPRIGRGSAPASSTVTTMIDGRAFVPRLVDTRSAGSGSRPGASLFSTTDDAAGPCSCGTSWGRARPWRQARSIRGEAKYSTTLPGAMSVEPSAREDEALCRPRRPGRSHCVVRIHHFEHRGRLVRVAHDHLEEDGLRIRCRHRRLDDQLEAVRSERAAGCAALTSTVRSAPSGRRASVWPTLALRHVLTPMIQM